MPEPPSVAHIAIIAASATEATLSSCAPGRTAAQVPSAITPRKPAPTPHAPVLNGLVLETIIEDAAVATPKFTASNVNASAHHALALGCAFSSASAAACARSRE